MSRTERAIVLLAVQSALVLSIAAKYVYERKVCPRVWVRAVQFDPEQPLRGRYLALQLAVDACALPRDEAHHTQSDYRAIPPSAGSWQWTVRTVAQGGKLLPLPATDTDRPELTDQVTIWGNGPCDRATLSKGVDYFIPDTAATPFPVKKSEGLWVEVTVPPMGQPRPIQLALSKDGAFTPLNLR
jgi:uncharacterized membrane-anchored protein